MDATQMISDSILESDEEGNEEEREDERGQPLAKLCILKNEHIPQTELPLFLGENVLGRDPNTCTLLLPAPSISKQHATICISVYRRRGCHSEVDMEALVWDLGSMNGTRKGRLKLTPNVRYALSESDSLVVADIPCQYLSVSQGDLKTPGSINAGVKARLPDASGKKESDTSTGSMKCVNEGTKARAVPVLEDTRKTPVHPSCLSFEQTPTHPQGTLVPESDSDSDGEKGGGRDRRRKAQVSDSDSHKSPPTCSTFLSPTYKIVPESEDESPITPSFPTKNRPHRHVSFSKEETDEDVGRQQLKEKKALAICLRNTDGQEEEGREEERAALGGRKSDKSGQHVPVKQGSDVSLRGEGHLPVSTPTDFTDAIPAFNMDSDTDMEGEEEGVAAVGPVTLNKNQQAGQPPDTAQFHLDSDTDLDEDDGAIDPKSVPLSADNIKPSCVISLIKPEGITMDSDTDVDDDAAVSDAAVKAKPSSFQNTHTTDIAPPTQHQNFHLDSDTDVDEEEEKECVTNNTCSKIDETSSRLVMKPIGPESVLAAPHSLHLDSDTDDEAIPAPANSEPLAVSAVTESRTTADTGTDLGKLSDSDTDVEENIPLVIPVVATDVSVGPDMTEAHQSDSEADTDVDDSSMPPAGKGVSPAKFSVDSDIKVEDKEVDFGEEGEIQTPGLQRGKIPGLLAPLFQNCSTPVQLSEGDVQDMETQAFLSPSPGPFKCAVASAVRPKAFSSCSDSQEDEDVVVAETQSFVLQTRDCQVNPQEDHTTDPTQDFGLESSGDEKSKQSSRGGSFQLVLSDRSHLQCQAQAQAMESTQAFVSVEGGVNLEDTQVYPAISKADRTLLEDDSNLEATQAFGEEEHARCSVRTEREDPVDLALEATQAYVSEPYSNSEDETDEDERKNTAGTQPLDFPTSSTLTIAETQPMSAFKDEESFDGENSSSVLQVKLKPNNQKQGREEHQETAQPSERGCSQPWSVAETQPICRSDNEETDDEDLVPGPRKRKAKPLQHEEEQTQPLTCFGLSLVETQPMLIGVDEAQTMATSGNEESDAEDSILGLRKHKAKQLQCEEEETQTLRNSELSGVDMGEHEDSDEEDSIVGPRKRKARLLLLQEEQTQSLTSSELSAVETQPMVTGEDGESDEEDSIPGPRKRKAKLLLIREEETQLLSNSEASTVETLSLETKADLQPQRGKGRQSETETSGMPSRGKRGTRARLREEEEQAECSEPPKRQTRRSNKSLPTTRGRRPKSKHEDESEEEEEVEHAKQARRKKSTRQQKDNEEEERERKEKEDAERLRREQERTEKERIERERKEQEEKERADREEREKQLERERKEKEEKERLECAKAEREEKERIEKERKKQEETEKLETAKREQEERLERERKEQEEKERADRTRKEKEEQLERERKEEEKRKGLEREKAEREEKERIEKARKVQEEIERLETAKREEVERLEKEEQEKTERDEQEKDKPKAAARGRRAARTTIVTPTTTHLHQDSEISTNDDVPARRTRSRSNSSNSVSSERSGSSVNTQQSSGRGRGRGTKRTSEPSQAAAGRNSNRRRTVAAGPTGQDSKDISPHGVCSRSDSTNSLSSEISSCSVSSQSRGRGGRQRGRGRKTETEPDSIPAVNDESQQNPPPKSTARGRKSRKAVESSNEVSHEDDKEKADFQQASTTRGQWRADAKGSEPAAADEEDTSNQEEGCASRELLLPKKNTRGRGQQAVESETVETPVTPAVIDGDEAKEKRRGRKRELEANTGEGSSSCPNISKRKERAQTTETMDEDEAKDETPVQTKRTGRASSAQAKKNATPPTTEVEVKEEGEKMEENVERRVRGRPSAVQKKKEEQEECGSSVDQDARMEASEPQTPTSSVSRKRQAPADSLPVAKTSRSSSASPAASGRSRIVSQDYKVLFTGVVDEEGERVLARLGGSIAKGVTDMNCLVTDKVRRTVKFLCAVAKGVPIVNTHWLEKSGKTGSFLSPNGFVVKDLEQEKKFSFCLQESLKIASSQPLLHGYAIHVTKSVKPEPAQMKDIISCSGATFLPKMPSSHKPQTVVISCEEDWLLCSPALTASLPVVTAEFILTGILQQKVDLQVHSLLAPTSNLPPAGGRGRGRKRT